VATGVCVPPSWFRRRPSNSEQQRPKRGTTRRCTTTTIVTDSSNWAWWPMAFSNEAEKRLRRKEQNGAVVARDVKSKPWLFGFDPIHPLSPYYGSVPWRSGGWSLIPNLLLISDIFNARLCARLYACRIMLLVIYCCGLDMNWYWDRVDEVFGLINCVIKVIFGTVMWRREPKLCSYMWIMAIQVVILS